MLSPSISNVRRQLFSRTWLRKACSGAVLGQEHCEASSLGTSPVHTPEIQDRGDGINQWRNPTKDKPAEYLGHEDAEQQLFSFCIATVQLDALG